MERLGFFKMLFQIFSHLFHFKCILGDKKRKPCNSLKRIVEEIHFSKANKDIRNQETWVVRQMKQNETELMMMVMLWWWWWWWCCGDHDDGGALVINPRKNCSANSITCKQRDELSTKLQKGWEEIVFKRNIIVVHFFVSLLSLYHNIISYISIFSSNLPIHGWGGREEGALIAYSWRDLSFTLQ